MALETEIKYLGVDFEALRKRLFELGAVSGGAHFESNLLLDTPDGRLRKQGRLLRLRLQEWPRRIRCVATFKKPPEFVAPEPETALAGFTRPKKMEELEFPFGDFENCLAVFENLGYEIFCRYEKARESYRLQAGESAGGAGIVEVELDRLNFISVVEIEGREDALRAAERILDLDNFKKSSTNYHKLHQEWLRNNGRPASNDFVFEEPERKRLRLELGLE